MKRLEGQTAGFGSCFHLPGFQFGTGFLSHSRFTWGLVPRNQGSPSIFPKGHLCQEQVVVLGGLPRVPSCATWKPTFRGPSLDHFPLAGTLWWVPWPAADRRVEGFLYFAAVVSEVFSPRSDLSGVAFKGFWVPRFLLKVDVWNCASFGAACSRAFALQANTSQLRGETKTDLSCGWPVIQSHLEVHSLVEHTKEPLAQLDASFRLRRDAGPCLMGGTHFPPPIPRKTEDCQQSRGPSFRGIGGVWTWAFRYSQYFIRAP